MSASQFLRRALAPGRPERAIAIALSLGALTLIDPAKLGAGKRAACRTALAGILAADLATDVPQGTSRAARATIAALGAGAVVGLSPVGEALDGKLQRSLASRGVRRPRVALAIAGAALSLASDLPGLLTARRVRGALPGWADPDGGDTTIGELPDGARALIAGMLEFSAEPGARALAAQLGAARERVWQGVPGSYDAIDLDVAEAAAAPRAVPHEQRFPVTAQFRDPDSGAGRTVHLFVEAGLLARLTIDESADEATAAGSARGGRSSSLWPSRWPALAEVTYALESGEPSDRRAANLARLHSLG